MTKVEQFEVVEEGTGVRFTAKSVRPIRKDRSLTSVVRTEGLAEYFLEENGEELLRSGNKFRGRNTDRMFLIVDEE